MTSTAAGAARALPGFELPAAPAPGVLALTADDLRLLAFLHDREMTAEVLAELKGAPAVSRFSLRPDDDEARAAFSMLDAALAAEECAGSPQALDVLAADYAAIYLNHALQISPAEGTFVDPEGLVRQDSMFEVRRWYEHYQMRAPDWRMRPDDHLVLQLQFIAHLLDAPTPDAPKDAAAFMDHHISRWIEPFAQRVARRCDTQFYAGLALVTAALLKRLRQVLATETGMPLIEVEPIEEEKRRRREKAQAEAARFVPGVSPSW